MEQKIITIFYFKSGNSLNVEQLFEKHVKERSKDILKELNEYMLVDKPSNNKRNKIVYHNTIIDISEVEAIEVISCAHSENGWIMDIDLGE